MLLRSLSALSCVCVWVIASHAAADNWPQWRGEKLDGISNETNLPTKWSKSENVAWRLPLPGPAGSTPAIWGDRIFLTTVDSADLVLMCVGTDGKQQWRQTVSTGNRDVRGTEGNSAAPSPSTDGKHVWTFMADGTLACYTVDGKQVWKLNLQDRYGKFDIAFGLTSTPVLDRGKLYVQLIHGEGDPATNEAIVACLDATTGNGIWKQARPSDGRKECEHSYASPVIYRDEQQAFLITHGADYVVAHDLQDGRELWRCGDLNPKASYNPTLRFVASPVAVPGMIVVPSAKNGPVLCLRPNIEGDVSQRESAFYWQRPRDTPDVPSPLVHEGLVYLCREKGILICLDAKTGKEHYSQTLSRGDYRASPVYADGKILATNRNGKVSVVKAGPKFELLAENDMEETLAASPAISGGRIYLRTFDALYAIGR